MNKITFHSIQCLLGAKKRTSTFCFGMIIFTVTFCQTSFSQSITLDYSNQKQQVVMVGTDMERSQSFLQKAADPQEISDWLYKDIPFTVCRVSYDKQQELVEGQKNLAFYDNAIKSMKLVKLSNPAILFFATMKSDYNGYNNQNNLPDWICDYKPTTRFDINKYAGFLADYLQLMYQSGVTISYISVSKEWTSVITPSRTIDIINALKPLLTSRGVPIPKFTDPAAWAVNQGVTFVNQIVGLNAQSLFYAFSTHEYNNSSSYYASFVTACTNAGAHPWNDETSVGGGDRTSGAEPVNIEALLAAYTNRAYMYNSGIDGEIFFEPFSRGVDSETRSIYFSSGMFGRRMRAYYIMQQFASNVLLRKYLPASNSGLTSVSTMAFANNDEIALWVINNSVNNYQSVNLNFTNTNILGSVFHFVNDTTTDIRGTGTVLTAQAQNQYLATIKPKSINFFKIHLKSTTPTDSFTVDADSLDYGFVSLTGTKQKREIHVTAQWLGSNITTKFTGTNANAFSLVGDTVIPASPLVWDHPLIIQFNPTFEGDYSATLNLSSASKTVTIKIKGSAYNLQTITVPFVDSIPKLAVNSGPITNAILNSFAKNKGWEIRRGLNSTADRINIASDVDDEGYIKTPEIGFNGPFEVKFFARMLLNDIGTTTADKVNNNLLRNIYAVLGSDTVYDHKKSGATLFQNYNEWTFTYAFTGNAHLKFVPGVSNSGVWLNTNDGLSFGPKGVSIRVQPTILPTVNIAYGHSIYLGSLNAGSSLPFSFPLKGWNLTQQLTLALPTGSNLQLNQLQFTPNSGKVDDVVSGTINAHSINPGIYTEKVTLTGESNYIRTRTLWLTYEVLQTTGITTSKKSISKVFADKNRIIVECQKPVSIEIYSITGRMVAKDFGQGTRTFYLQNGIYIVRTGHEVTKVLVHN